MSLKYSGKIFILTLLALFYCGDLMAADVVLDSGYLAGQVQMGNLDTSSINIIAKGGGYSSYKNTPNNSAYTVTVQGGVWDYKVTTSATFTKPVTGESTYMSFADRYFQVAPAATVTNDYVFNPGIVHFDVQITGDAYTAWWASSFARKTPVVGEEKSWSYTSTQKSATAGSWEMSVVPNQAIPITTTVYVDGVGANDIVSFPFDFGMIDLAPGEVVTIPIQINFVAPITTPTPPPPASNYYYGYVEGTSWLKNVPAENIWFTGIFSGGDRVGGSRGNPGDHSARFYSTNPDYSFATTLRAGTYFMDPLNNTNQGGQLYWPYIDGIAENNKVQVTMGQTTIKDFILDAGFMSGHLHLRGPLTEQQLSGGGLTMTGASTKTNGGWFSGGLNPGVPTGYYWYLSEGDWTPGGFSLQRDVTTPRSYYSSMSVNYADQATALEDLGWTELPHIIPNQDISKDINFCVGDVIYRFRDTQGGLLTRPVISGTGKRTVNSIAVLTSNVRSSSRDELVAVPEVEIFGPEGDYSLSASVTAEDSSRIQYPPMNKHLTCGVQEIIDLPGPTLNVTAPFAGLLTNALSLNVAGNAVSGSTISSVTVNGQGATLTPISGSTDGTQVDFTYDLVLTDGTNQITTQVIDASGAQASETRNIRVDRWLPEVQISLPTTDGTIWQEDGLAALQVNAADQGYGYTLVVSLDGQAIYQVDGAGDETLPVPVAFNRELGTLADGSHSILAVATDLAGNVTQVETTFIAAHDIWAPQVAINTPTPGSLFSGIDNAIALAVSGSDQGAGFNMTVELDGVVIDNATGAANVQAPEQLNFSSLIGPLTSGSHTLRASVTDRSGQTATAESLFLVDGWLPVVAFSQPAPASSYSYTDSAIPVQADAADQGYGYTLEVSLDGTMLGQMNGPADDLAAAGVSFSGQVGTLALGEHLLTAIVADAAGNTAQAEQLVTIIDDQPPVMTLLSSGAITLTAGTPFVDPGVTAIDEIDGDLTTQVLVTGVVDATTPGSYPLTYSVADMAGNAASLSRLVTIIPAVSTDDKCEDDDSSDDDSSDDDSRDNDSDDDSSRDDKCKKDKRHHEEDGRSNDD